MYGNNDLFDNLAHVEPYHYEMRDEGSFKPKNRHTEGEVKMVM